MNDSSVKLREMVRGLLEPVFDAITDNVMTLAEHINMSAASLGQQKAEELLKKVLSDSAESMRASIKSSVPVDIDKKLKEAMNASK